MVVAFATVVKREIMKMSEGEIPTEILSLSACLDFSTPGEDNTV